MYSFSHLTLCQIPIQNTPETTKKGPPPKQINLVQPIEEKSILEVHRNHHNVSILRIGRDAI